MKILFLDIDGVLNNEIDIEQEELYPIHNEIDIREFSILDGTNISYDQLIAFADLVQVSSAPCA